MHEPSIPWWREQPIPITSVEQEAKENDGDFLSFWALMAFTFILLLAPQLHYPFLAPLRIAMLTAVLAVLTHLFSRLARGLPVIEFTPPVVIILCLLGWLTVMIPFSFWPTGSIEFLMENYLKTIIIFVLLANVINTTEKLKRICWGLVLMSVPLALTTVKNFLSGNSMGGNDRIVGYMASLTENPNDMALMLNLILPLSVALFLDTAKTGLRFMLGAIICLLVMAIIATFSRAGFLTLGVVFLTYLWLLRNRPERRWGALVLLVAVCAFPLVPGDYVERINTIVNIEEDTSNSAQTRLSDMKVAASLVIQHPFIGAGIGMNVLAMNEARGETWTEVHNVYLQYAVELGLPGLMLFLLLYGKCLATTRMVLEYCRSRSGLNTLFHLTEGIRVSLVAFAVAAMFHPVAYHFYFYYIAGLAVAAVAICNGIATSRQVGAEPAFVTAGEDSGITDATGKHCCE